MQFGTTHRTVEHAVQAVFQQEIKIDTCCISRCRRKIKNFKINIMQLPIIMILDIQYNLVYPEPDDYITIVVLGVEYKLVIISF